MIGSFSTKASQQAPKPASGGRIEPGKAPAGQHGTEKQPTKIVQVTPTPVNMNPAHVMRSEVLKESASKTVKEMSWPTQPLDEDWDLDQSIHKLNATNKSSARGHSTQKSEAASKVGAGLMNLNKRIVPLPMEASKVEKLTSPSKPRKAENMRNIINQYA